MRGRIVLLLPIQLGCENSNFPAGIADTSTVRTGFRGSAGERRPLGCRPTIRTLACLLLLAADLRAQQYVFRAYRQAEGLKNLAVKGLAVDRSGFLWVGTENGLYRFLGSGFEVY